MKNEHSWVVLGYMLIFIGIIIIFSAIIFGILSGLNETTIHGGAVGCIIIFFIPICFGAGTNANILYALSILGFVIVIILLVFMLLFIKRAVKTETY
ncbi:MAG: hypothetical protein J7L82_01015 [Staphylothermus sp.]|nr:hypothetical protein [Staphylothermus sp.]